MSRKVIFIINPKAGVKKKMDVPAFIERHFSPAIEKEIVLWENANDFDSIRRRISEGGFTIAVAVGGDGTVNQVAAALNHTDVALGILPFGSGNGLARSIGVSMDIQKALKQIESGTVRKIDSGMINNFPFFCTSGTGFDAQIGHRFASSTKRGFWTYCKIIFRELFSYVPREYEINIDGKELKQKAFLLTFANAGQYGNDFYIAPGAQLDDGQLQLVVVRPFSIWVAPFIVRKVFKRKPSRYISISAGKDIRVKVKGPTAIHFDGEPVSVNENIQVSIMGKTLNVIS
ncbi:MAG: diacylglycerol kinase [Bacteroidetes bacterium]|jgi:YegS/Rv2252/BmrU family lipid kinase|nr:diacylglycerol kinase [Bacteroidota bacterium]